jgi:Tol biopolymer transport system component
MLTRTLNERREEDMRLTVESFAVIAVVLTFPGFAAAKSGSAFGSRIAFVQGPDIFTMNPDGSDVRQLTNLGANNSAFFESWSPDGRQLVFSEYPNNGLVTTVL